MKKKFLKSSLDLIKKNNPTLDDIKIEEIRYGLESVYLTITKLVIIFLIAYMLNIVRSVFILMVTFNIIRNKAFGLHATKSIYCLISSLLLFIGGSYVCDYVVFPIVIKVILAVICVICICKYAPADTVKRPLVNAEKRRKYRMSSIHRVVIYTILIIIFDKYTISNYLLIGMIEAVIMIHPKTYKFFKLPFNNYKNYEYGV